VHSPNGFGKLFGWGVLDYEASYARFQSTFDVATAPKGRDNQAAATRVLKLSGRIKTAFTGHFDIK